MRIAGDEGEGVGWVRGGTGLRLGVRVGAEGGYWMG